MEDEIAKTKVWLDYIGKLNERALNRQRASGATTWVVLGVIAILLEKVLAHLPKITTDLNIAAIHLTALTGVIDCLVFSGLFLLHLMSFGDTSSSESRLRSRVNRTSQPFSMTLICIASLAFGGANLITSRIASPHLLHWPFFVLGLFFLINGLGHPTIKIKTWIKHKDHFLDLPDLLYPQSVLSVKQRNIGNFILTIVVLGLLCISLVPIIQSLPQITTDKHVKIIIWSLYGAGLIFLSLFLFSRSITRNYDVFLYQLERRIVLESLPSDVIRSEFVREFIGEDVADWLKEAERERERLIEKFNQTVISVKEKIAELTAIDSSMQFEINGRREIVIRELYDASTSYLKYAERFLHQISHLCDQNAHFHNADLFKQVSEEWKLKTTMVNDVTKSLYNEFKN